MTVRSEPFGLGAAGAARPAAVTDEGPRSSSSGERGGTETLEAALETSVARARAGDAAELGRLCERFYPEIFRFLSRRLPPEDAEDVASEVFVRAVKGLPRQTGFFPAWLYRIARNLMVDHLRRRARQATVPLERAAELTVPAASPGNPDAVGLQVDLERALGMLPGEQQELIALRFVEGYTAAEAGAILGKSAEAVRAQQLRALRSLRRYLAERRNGRE